MSSVSTRSSVYQIITEQILEALDKGVVPWRRPWGGKQLAPRSAQSQKLYRGVNVWLLFISSELAGYESPFWVTYKQAQSLGGQVRKGEKSTVITFWTSFVPKTDENLPKDEQRNMPCLRYYRVFNVAQVDGLPDHLYARPDVEEHEHDPIAECEQIAGGYVDGPEIEHGGFKACYQPEADRIIMPRPELFERREEYYSTLFHEQAHSTGHEKRLNRDTLGTADLETYGKEELIAEMTAALLCGVAGIAPATIDNSAAYLKGWSDTIKQDPKLVIHAAAAAQRAADLILGQEGGER